MLWSATSLEVYSSNSLTHVQKNGDSEPSVAAEMLEAGVDEGIVRDLVGGAYIAGTDTVGVLY
jgi:hypothetical protein